VAWPPTLRTLGGARAPPKKAFTARTSYTSPTERAGAAAARQRAALTRHLRREARARAMLPAPHFVLLLLFLPRCAAAQPPPAPAAAATNWASLALGATATANSAGYWCE
jgi:hypothetical protein